MRNPLTVKSPDNTAANSSAVSGWIGLKAATGVGCRDGLAQGVEFGGGLAGQRHPGQRSQETTVGGMGHLGVAPEIGDPLGHRTPPRLLVGGGRPEHLELPRIVDGRLNPEHVGMVVELDGVGLEAEAHPAALAPSAVNRNLTGKRRVRLAPEEVQDLGGTQRGDRGGHQIALDRLQRRALGKQDVAGVFALVDHPPVAGKAGVRDGGQQRIDQVAWRSRTGGQSVWANRSHSAATARSHRPR